MAKRILMRTERRPPNFRNRSLQTAETMVRAHGYRSYGTSATANRQKQLTHVLPDSSVLKAIRAGTTQPFEENFLSQSQLNSSVLGSDSSPVKFPSAVEEPTL